MQTAKLQASPPIPSVPFDPYAHARAYLRNGGLLYAVWQVGSPALPSNMHLPLLQMCLRLARAPQGRTSPDCLHVRVQLGLRGSPLACNPTPCAAGSPRSRAPGPAALLLWLPTRLPQHLQAGN